MFIKVQNLLRRLEFHAWYFRQPPWDTGVSPPELLEFLQNREPSRAIDLGCGTGTNVITLARAGWQVTGVDFAPSAIKIAKQKARMAGVEAELLVRDVTRLRGIDGPFDLAFDLGCFHGISTAGRAGYLKELERILAPRGFWLLYGFLKPSADQAGAGLAEVDISRISSRFALVWRRDGMDDGRKRPSSWVLFRNSPGPAKVGTGGRATRPAETFERL